MMTHSNDEGGNMSTNMRIFVRTMLLVLVVGLSWSARANAQCTGGFPTCCLGDCNGNGTLSAGDLTKVITTIINCNRVAAGCATVTGGCLNADKNHDGVISAGELTNIIFNITNSPNGCPVVATATPTNTVPLATPTASATVAAVCGNGIVEGSEGCDDGGTCVGGPDGVAPAKKCPANVAGGVNRIAPGVCTPFGGDGCASNCTHETTVHFKFTGAKCVGGANNGAACLFNRYCLGGAFPGRPCSATQLADCGPAANRGVCVSECALVGLSPTGAQTNDSSDCAGVGGCSNNASTTCPSLAGKDVPPTPGLICQGGTRAGTLCTLPPPAPTPTPASAFCGAGGSCINPCGAGNTCIHKTGAVLSSVGLIGNLSIGPISGSNDMILGEAGADGVIPVVVPASSVIFKPVTVPALACACPHGVANPVFGPGNSGAGLIGCGASGLQNVDVTLFQDHSTSPGASDTNGPGTCSGGTRAGLACSISSDCGAGGSCNGVGGGGGICVVGTNNGKPCKANADCGAGGLCNSPDDTTGNCSLMDPQPPDGSGQKACLEKHEICTNGANAGNACAINSDCGITGAFCGTSCNALSPHAGTCNSPVHLALTGSGPPGSGIVVTSTAIGVIQGLGEARPCRRFGACELFAFNATPVACEVTAQCTAPKNCVSAYCAGLCTAGPKIGSPCIKVADCGSGGVCTPGANFAKGCTGLPNECGADNKCVPFSPDRGFDGLPCTADDPLTSQGTAAAIPTTTGLSAASVADVDGVPGYFMSGGFCSGSFTAGAKACNTTRVGHPFNCSALVNQHSASGASVASAFETLDGNQTGDTLVTNGLTAE